MDHHGPAAPSPPAPNPGLGGWAVGWELLTLWQKSKQFEQGNVKGSVAPGSEGETNGHNDKLAQDALTQQSRAASLLKLFPKQMFPARDYCTGKCGTEWGRQMLS